MELKRLEAKNNDTGTLVEAFKLPTDGQVFYLVIKPGETRGNHYHLRKTERFVVVHGSARIAARNRATNHTIDIRASATHATLATIRPNTTHKITASDDGCVCLVWCDEQFDESDPDTFAEEV